MSNSFVGFLTNKTTIVNGSCPLNNINRYNLKNIYILEVKFLKKINKKRIFIVSSG